jgi:hypothetical protein
MTLVSLYQTHADVCLEMAAISKTREIKEQWLELADNWRQKANRSEGLPEAAAEPSPQPIPAVTAPDIFGHNLSGIATTEPPASQDVLEAPNAPTPSLSPTSGDVTKPGLQIKGGSDMSPSLSPSLPEVSNQQLPFEEGNDVPPSLIPSLHVVANPQAQIDTADDRRRIEHDDDWNRVLADIRGR